MTKYRQLLHFLRNTALDVMPDLLLPGAAGMVVKLCQHFYCCFVATGPQDRLELLNEARELSEGETNDVIDALAEAWKDHLPEGRLNDHQRVRLRDLVLSLRAAAGRGPGAAEQAEELRSSLERSLAADNGHIPARPLSPAQLLVGRSVMARVLARDAGSGRAGRRPLPADAPTVPGHVLAALLGGGGFSRVFLGQHQASGEWRAVKVGRLDDPRRFRTEVETLQRLARLPPDSPLVRYHEHGELPGGHFWIAMEYLGDHTLADLISCPASRPDTELALHLGEQILRGLVELHSLKILHRDLKPENVMVDAQFRVRLIDFGLAKPTLSMLATQVTVGFVGTPLYASPEQVDEEPLSLATDIWPLGCVLYQLLTGQPPFQPRNPLQVSATLRNTTVVFDRHEIPPELREFLPRCIALNRAERFHDAAAALAAFLPRKEECVRRLRCERYLPSWLPVLERGLLQRFAAQHRGELPAKVVALFVAFAAQEGCTGLDEVRLDEILPPIFEKQSEAEASRRRLYEARLDVKENALSQDLPGLEQQVARVRQLERALAEREQEVVDKISELLPAEVSFWADSLPSEQVKRERRVAAARRHVLRSAGVVLLFLIVAGVMSLGVCLLFLGWTPAWTSSGATIPAIDASTQSLVIDLGKGASMKFVRIPAGGKTFWMGSPAREENHYKDEEQHQVTFKRDFFMGVFEVTQAQYEAVIGRNPSWLKSGPDYPVTNVSWFDARTYCDRLNQRLSEVGGPRFRLPTEAEWEYACRGGVSSKDTKPFCFKSGATTSLTARQANFNGNHPQGSEDSGPNRQQTTPVGSFEANAFGLHDMHGNVHEWCEDWYGPYSSLASTTDPVQTVKQREELRVERGGAWASDARQCRAAHRGRYAPGTADRTSGFRVVLALP
jgi:formylglycine-generating enzyme required for sulfatase activity